MADEEVLALIVRMKDEASTAMSRLEGHFGSMKSTMGEMVDKGKEVGGDKGMLSGIAAGLSVLPGPLGLAAGGFAGMSGILDSAMSTYNDTELQLKQLDIAIKGHGLDLQSFTKAIDDNEKQWEQYGYSVADVRPALTQLVQAGLTQQQAFGALTPIMDLARASNVSLTQASADYGKGLVGNIRALSEYGIKLDKVNTGDAAYAAAQQTVTKETDRLQQAQADLGALTDSLSAKMKLSAQDHLELANAQSQVQLKSDALKAAEDDLAKTQADLNNKQTVTADDLDRLQKAQLKVDAATTQLHSSEDKLAATQVKLTDKQQLSVDQHARLEAAQRKVQDASLALTDAQQKLGQMEDTNANRGQRLKDINDAITGSVGGEREGVNALTVVHAKLSDKWDHFAQVIGPAVEAALGSLLDVLNGVVETLANIAGGIQSVLNVAGSVGGAVGGALGAIGIGGPNTANPKAFKVGKHASGGRMEAGEPGIVGEGGPELFVPRVAGNILPHGTFGMPSGQPVVLQVKLDGRTIAELVDERLSYRYTAAARTSGAV